MTDMSGSLEATTSRLNHWSILWNITIIEMASSARHIKENAVYLAQHFSTDTLVNEMDFAIKQIRAHDRSSG